MTISLARKLLCASRQAYNITANGPVAPAPQSEGIGWIAAPAGFVYGFDRIDAALLGETANEIIVAFRGTLPPQSPDTCQTILDWLNDCDAALAPVPGLPGRVHQGFLGCFHALWPALSPALGALSTANIRKPVYITGHSKGGAVANIAALFIRGFLSPAVPAMVTTFAAAKPGDDDFATGYNKIITHSVRYEFQDDIVPHIPPSDEFFQMFSTVPSLAPTVQRLEHGYSPAGDLIFIDWNRALVPDSPLLRFQRYAHLAELIVTLGCSTIIADHSIDVGSGYDTSVV